MTKKEFLIEWCMLKGKQTFIGTDEVIDGTLPLAIKLWDAIEEAAPSPRYVVTHAPYPKYIRPTPLGGYTYE